MKILKRGTPPAPPKYLGVCGRCRTEVEAEDHERKYEHGDGPYPGYYYVTCPVCGVNLRIVEA